MPLAIPLTLDYHDLSKTFRHADTGRFGRDKTVDPA